jgi:hypothetical protein
MLFPMGPAHAATLEPQAAGGAQRFHMPPTTALIRWKTSETRLEVEAEMRLVPGPAVEQDDGRLFVEFLIALRPVATIAHRVNA